MQSSPRQIAMETPRLYEDFRLTDADPARIREIGVVGTAYDSVMAMDITYVSTPITSGAALYAAMDAAGVSDPAELRRDKAAFAAHVIEPNLKAAEAVAHAMVRDGGAVIAPAAFEARSLGWGQDEYMGLWLDVIERRATRLALVDGWQYSNGGAEEYLQALLMQAGRRDRSNMRIIDARGGILSHVNALKQLAGAVADLIGRGFEPTVLARVLHRCIILHGMVRDETDYGQSSDACGRGAFALGEGYAEAGAPSAEMRETVQGMRHILAEARLLLATSELQPRSSLELAPGIVRSTGRSELEQSPVVIITDEEEGPDPH